MSLAAKLRDLLSKATPGPWNEPHLSSHAAGDCRCGYIFAWEAGEELVATVHKSSDSHDSEYPRIENAEANSALIVTLRNAAPAMLALVEAVEALRKGIQRKRESAYASVNLGPVFDALVALEESK